MEQQRNLTDDDVKALADELEARLERRFYSNLGKGVWAVVWKLFVLGILFLVASGAVRDKLGG